MRNILRRMNVKAVCTTDDPVDTLEYHRQLKEDGFEIPVLPALRPDTAMDVSDVSTFNGYLRKLEMVSNVSIISFNDFLTALKNRHDFFATMGCSVSEHGLEEIYAADFNDAEIHSVFNDLRAGKSISPEMQYKFKSAMLLQFAEWDCEKGWVQQYHLGALRTCR